MTKRKKSDLIEEKPADMITPTEEREENVRLALLPLVMAPALIGNEEKEGPRVAGGEKTPAPPAPEIPWWQIEEDIENIFGE